MSPNDGRFVDRSEFDYQQQIRMLRGQDPLLPMTAVIFEDSHSSYSGWRIRWRPEDRWIERLDFFAVYNDDHQNSNGNENINDLLAVSTPTHCDETVQTLHHGHPSRPWRRITVHLASVERPVLFARMVRIVIFVDRLSLLLLTLRQNKQGSHFFTTMHKFRHIHEPFEGGSAQESFVKPPIKRLKPTPQTAWSLDQRA